MVFVQQQADTHAAEDDRVIRQRSRSAA
jgi:hypothetical protein